MPISGLVAILSKALPRHPPFSTPSMLFMSVFFIHCQMVSQVCFVSHSAIPGLFSSRVRWQFGRQIFRTVCRFCGGLPFSLWNMYELWDVHLFSTPWIIVVLQTINELSTVSRLLFGLLQYFNSLLFAVFWVNICFFKTVFFCLISVLCLSPAAVDSGWILLHCMTPFIADSQHRSRTIWWVSPWLGWAYMTYKNCHADLGNSRPKDSLSLLELLSSTNTFYILNPSSHATPMALISGPSHGGSGDITSRLTSVLNPFSSSVSLFTSRPTNWWL